MIKFTGALIILFIALALQFFFSSAGIFIDLSFAALIAFAFTFGIWELVPLVLIATFIVNWQPAASIEIAIFALYPVAAHFVYKTIPWEPWLVVPAAIVVGSAILYLSISPVAFVTHLPAFLIDVVAGSLFALVILRPLHHWDK